MDDLERMLAERACERLMHLYARYSDTGDERMPDIFAEDGVLEIYQRLEGREGIRSGRAGRPPLTMRHICSNLMVDVIDADNARGHCYVTAYVGPEGAKDLGLPAVVGEYTDEFVRTTDGWKINYRLFTPTLTRPA